MQPTTTTIETDEPTTTLEPIAIAADAATDEAEPVDGRVFTLTPEDRAHAGPWVSPGTRVPIAGAVWLLADHVPYFEPLWDRLYDAAVLKGSYDVDDVGAAGVRLLLANYDLSAGEVAALVRAANPADLVAALELALFGPTRSHRTYTEWVTLVLLANRIDRADVPPHMLTYLMDYLESAGLAIPAAEFISSAAAVRRRAQLGLN